MANSGGGSGDEVPKGISLANMVHSEVAPSLPLASLPVVCGAPDQNLRLFDGPRSVNRTEVLNCAATIADLLRNTDASYMNRGSEDVVQPDGHVGNLELYDQVIRYNPEAFECKTPGLIKEPMSNRKHAETKFNEQSIPTSHRDLLGAERSNPTSQLQRDHVVAQIYQPQRDHVADDGFLKNNKHDDAVNPRKPKVKRKGNNDISSSIHSGVAERQDAVVGGFCEILEDFCGKIELSNEDRDESEWLPVPVADLRVLVNEIVYIRSKKLLPMVPVDILVRTLRILDHQIHRAEGLSINEYEHSDSNVVSSIYSALEAIHAALAVMACNGMPKQIYKEEIIERILEFSRHQIIDIMAACDPTYRALHKPNDNGALQGEEDQDDEDFGSARKRRTGRSVKGRKSIANKVSAAVNFILQKLCTIIEFLKELLSIERLPDSCILQLVRTCSTSFLVDNIQLLQLKAIRLISGIYHTYTQHRPYVMDEAVQVLLKLPSSKRMPRTYHLPDEDQKQIQIITALLVQLVHCSANLPEGLRQTSGTSSLEVSIDADSPTKCHEAVTTSCCLFWSGVLERFASTKSQEASELKTMMENLVMDLLTTLNLPEYPASAPILEVLCVLLLQNAGLKSKDIAARSMAIDLLGAIAARLKHDAVICREEKFWLVQELTSGERVDCSYPKDACYVCADPKIEKSILMCQDCQSLFHNECIGVREHEAPSAGVSCQICLCKKQLLDLKSYSESQVKDDRKENDDLTRKPSHSDRITNVEIAQQIILNYLHDAGCAEDVHLFTRWFYVCLWHKDDVDLQQNFPYYVARLKSKEIVRKSASNFSFLKRDLVKKISLALGQNSSFCRGFDKILQVLLASLRENSPIIRAKAMRAVSIIVEADPEVLCDKLVQKAVEGRFCDSAISVREAALELVGRHIASHPDVGLKYFEKVAERIKDTGVSVRKRAIKIIRDMCTSNATFSEFTPACIEIISRVSDEESSIQDLVCKTFYEFWFEESYGSPDNSFRDGSSVPLAVSKKTEQIVEMLRRMPSHQPLVTVIKRNLALDFFPQSAKAAGINQLSLASVRRRCELMCNCLLEKILQVAEMNSSEGDLRMLPYMLLLHAFCSVDPKLCAPSSDPSQFVVTLQPYLKSQADSRAAAQLLESIIFVIDSVMPLLRKLPLTVAEELEQDLKQMIVRHPFLTVVHACIKCLCSVTKMAGKGGSVVEYLIQLFYKRLDSLGFDNIQAVGRSLFCLGLLIRYGSSLLTASGKSFDVSRSLSLFKKYLQAENLVMKVRSLQALGYVLIARPECMLEKDVGKILEETLASSADAHLKMQSLQNMYEYLRDAETQLGTDKTSDDEVTYSTDGGHSVPVAAGAGDTNICGGIIQLYWDSILGRCLDVNEKVRQSALKIVEVVLRQGLVHPITCVPYLIALETDTEEVNSNLAHHLLMNMNEKYPSFFESRLGDGLQMSYVFIQSIGQLSPHNSSSKVQLKGAANTKAISDASSFAYARLGVSRIYKLIRGNRASRNKFMSSVVRKFDTISWGSSVIPFLIYCTEILAMLPFTLPDEPLYLIYTINRVMQVRAGTLEANMKAFLHLLQGDSSKSNGNRSLPFDTSGQPFSTNNMADDIKQKDEEEFAGLVYRHATMKDSDTDANPTTSGSSHVISCEDLKKIQVDYLAASALQLLLNLKRHLKIVYSLNDARCQAFSPNDPPKPGEVLSRQNVPFSIGEMSTEMPNSNEEFSQRYQEFKNALKEDTVDYSTYTANIKRKRAPPRKNAKSGQMIGGDDEDDDNDEDWRGSARRLNNSGRKTRSRQRL